MNFFEHHIGDYDQATAHLSAIEDGIYSRLIRWYMSNEGPLPAEIKAIQRRVRAHSRDERAAVQTILCEFFELRDGSYHQHRCDEEVARYLELQPDREAKKENNRERQKRARERRKALFDALRSYDIVPPFNTKTGELEALLSRAKLTPVTPTVTRDNTATHYPLPTTHYPDKEKEKKPPVSMRGSRLPPDWGPGEAGFAYAAQKGLNPAKVHTELEKFRDWWAAQPGQKGVKADWQATWRTWVRNSVERSGGKPAGDDMFAGAR